MPSPAFHEFGTVADKIQVAISLQIIGLFSEGLYSSPNKAVEELVSNAFDADATKVHVAVSRDPGASDATIAVIDNGTGMGVEGLKVHWIVGDSVKRKRRTTDRGRRSIGKFGIGKLAAYVLGDRLTHISKHDGKYYSTSMDFSRLPQTASVDQLDGSQAPPVTLDLRELEETEARAALRPWLDGDRDKSGIQLFGSGSEEHWTVAVISDLKSMASDLGMGRLRWVLSTALPLRDDFVLSLNTKKVESSKFDESRLGTWVLGKDILEFPRPAAFEVHSEEDAEFPEDNYQHWVIVDKVLGPISGYVEVFKDPLPGNKADKIGRSNGFFVYVHGRLINPEDDGFGINRNLLRHGTFSRLRVVVRMDRLDEELRSSRESLRDGPRLEQARAILQALFNFARGKFDEHEESKPTSRRVAQRLSESPAGLTERPVLNLAMDAFDGRYEPRHIEISRKGDFATAEDLLTFVEERIREGTGMFEEVSFSSMGVSRPLASYDPSTGALEINQDHQFVAHFADQFGDAKKNMPLQLLAVSEIVLEAQLYEAGVTPDILRRVMDDRDELLRNLAKGSGFRNSLTVAQALVGSVSSKAGMEAALVDAFDQLGFDAIPRGGNGRTDGVADANLPPGSDGKPRNYRVTLEAKSKENVGAKVSKSDVEVSTIARHRKNENADHAIVVGPDFVSGPNDTGALITEIDNDRESNAPKTITLMRASDLARLVRIAPVKRLNLEDIRGLFQARSPDEAAAWVDDVLTQTSTSANYKQILEAVWAIQEEMREAVTFDTLRTYLRLKLSLVIPDADLRNDCLALSRMADNHFYYFEDRVELKIKPETVLEMVDNYVQGVNNDEGE